MSELIDNGNGPINPRLLPPKNLRPTKPRACGSCKFMSAGDGGWNCIRPDEIGDNPAMTGDVGDGDYWMYVCDYWQYGGVMAIY